METSLLGRQVLAGRVLPTLAQRGVEEMIAVQEPGDDRQAAAQVLLHGDVSVFLTQKSHVLGVGLGVHGQGAQVGVDEGLGVDVVVGEHVPLEVDDEAAHPLDRLHRDTQVAQIGLGEGGRGGLVLATVAADDLLDVGGEDTAVVPAGDPHDVRVVRLLGQLIDPREHVDEVAKIVEATIRCGPALNEELAGGADRLWGLRGADRLHRAGEGGQKPLRCFDNTHGSVSVLEMERVPS